MSLIPHNTDAEEGVLGSILIDPTALLKVNDLEVDDFFDERSRWIYQAVVALQKAGMAVDQITVAHALDELGKLRESGGVAYLSHLVADVPTPTHAEHYARIVKNCAIQRAIISVAGRIAELGYNSPDLEKPLALLLALRARDETAEIISPHAWAEYTLEYVAALQHDEGKHSIPYGMPDLDKILGGVYPGELIILGGKPAIGKSTIIQSWARHMGERGKVLFVSLEMGLDQLTQRELAHALQVPIQKVRARQLTPFDYTAASEIMGEMAERKVYLLAGKAMTTTSLRWVCERMKLQQGLEVLFIDYLQRLRDNPKAPAYERMSFISSELKALAVELNIAVVAASQLSREHERRFDKHPSLVDLRDSGNIEADADIVMLLYRADAYYTEEEWGERYQDRRYPTGEAELALAKVRQGAGGKLIKLKWHEGGQEYLCLSR